MSTSGRAKTAKVKAENVKIKKEKVYDAGVTKRRSTLRSASRKRVEIAYEVKKEVKDVKKLKKNFQKVWDGIAQMRSEIEAPVDSMGCAMWGNDKNIAPKTNRYHVLISLMLSSQTKDEVTFATMRKLLDHGLTPENIVNTSDEDLDALIYSAGFHRKKVQYIKKTSQTLIDEYDSDIPSTLTGLVALNGVGPKMAHLTLLFAWNKALGIGVDVHVHRISNRLGWVDNTKNPEQTRKALEEWLPKKFWGKNGINGLLVGFGQTVCKPRRPLCEDCIVSSMCPSAFKEEEKTKKKKPKKRKTK